MDTRATWGKGLTLARDRWRREVQGVSSGRKSRGLPKSCRERSCARLRRSITGADRRLASSDSSRSCEQRRISPAQHHGLNGHDTATTSSLLRCTAGAQLAVCSDSRETA